MNIVNITAYKFIVLHKKNLPVLQKQIKEKAKALELKGTILLSTEGMNLSMAGVEASITAFKNFLRDSEIFADLTYKTSLSTEFPFSRLVVRIKKEIIKMECKEIQPTQEKANYVSPQMFKQWYQEQREMVIIDARNNYEVLLGTFTQAINLQLDTFSDFPQAIENLPAWMKTKSVVTFCTGGIRCEKAALLLQKRGFRQVYQLEGGILNYFSQCGGEYFHGQCFVFDDRIAVNSDLHEASIKSESQ